MLVAFCIPSKARYKTFLFADRVKTLVRRFEACSRPRESILTNIEQHTVLRGLNQEIDLAEAPLQRMEDALHLPVALCVIPLFAFANAGIRIDMSSLASVLSSPISLGVMCGLVLGKFIGITGSAWLALRLGIGSLSQGINLQHLAGVGLLGGIGFTMSIFVAELSFPGNPEGLHMAKSGILLASLLAGVLGFFWLGFFAKKTA